MITVEFIKNRYYNQCSIEHLETSEFWYYRNGKPERCKKHRLEYWKKKYDTDPVFRAKHLSIRSSKEVRKRAGAKHYIKHKSKLENDLDYSAKYKEELRVKNERFKKRMEDPQYKLEYNKKALRRSSTPKRREQNEDSRLLREYGITRQQRLGLLEAQEFACAICGKHQSELKIKLAVDHDHSTSDIRGLLCKQCNIGLGHFGDSAVLLEKAIGYIRRSPAIPANELKKK